VVDYKRKCKEVTLWSLVGNLIFELMFNLLSGTKKKEEQLRQTIRR